ncbi:hypothetical protein VB774_16040 [Pseudanabaena galeata UHCC 0370]|jgi:hypothetical protein|uniref:PIN domain-containing protein n=1 Tax=Pseudanabaena galeata UHCC 0370 TaxID=3110310 RepID=A0ABU5TM89_9CYAN|nr:MULTISPECIES: hypothetical protein [Pseudanabaena]MEA5479133.1 hypothetical protein [Pseudanabaena galeata UHCC 0370]MEA5488302.1 hypothetical protein [Pseudanabaena sp. CCNP1317]WGS72871.1 hypothetical protein OA858_02260 [Pseudanabaena galeata CCNP1313]
MKSISIQISDERWLALQTKSEILQLSPEELLSRAIERVVHTPKKLQTPYPPTRRVFIDTNVLAQIVGNKSDGKLVIQCLQESGIEAVTFSKCVYELYSMIKGTTKDGKTPKSDGHPLKRFTKGDINDIGQRLFKKTNLTEKANTPYWFNLCEEWMWSDFFNSYEDLFEKYCDKSDQTDQEEIKETLSLQKDFCEWKASMRQSFSEIRQEISNNGITVFNYFEVFNSDWYQFEGFFWEQSFAQDSLIPNEDFELVLAAIALQASAFITTDNKELIWRGGLSLGLNAPQISFCCPRRIKEAIDTNFAFRYYPESKPY